MVQFSRVGFAALLMCRPRVIRFAYAEETQWG
jgi:hypothetical protein